MANDIYLEIEKSIQASYPLEVFFEPSRAACCWLSCNEVSRKPQGIITKNLIAIPFVTRIKSSLCSRAHSRAFLSALTAVRNVSASAFKSQEPHSLVWYWTGAAGLLVKTIWVTYKLRRYFGVIVRCNDICPLVIQRLQKNTAPKLVDSTSS